MDGYEKPLPLIDSFDTPSPPIPKSFLAVWSSVDATDANEFYSAAFHFGHIDTRLNSNSLKKVERGINEKRFNEEASCKYYGMDLIGGVFIIFNLGVLAGRFVLPFYVSHA